MSTTAAITNACATIPVQAAPEISTPEVLLPEGYTMLRKLGSGAFATVYKAQRESDGQIFAVKVIHLAGMTAREKEVALREDNHHACLDHPNIVSYEEGLVDPESTIMFLVLEYCPGGDLAMLIEEHRGSGQHIPEAVIWTYLRQLVKALHHCHEPATRSDPTAGTIIHRDIKPANVLLSRDRTQAKLADFGLSREIMHEEWATSFCGTPDYMPPEMSTDNFTDVRCNEAGDIWSLGCLLYELCTLELLFDEPDDNRLRKLIRNGANNPKLPVTYSRELESVMRSMLATNPSERPTTACLIETVDLRMRRASAAHKRLLEENRAQRGRIAELEAQLEFVLQHSKAQETAMEELRCEHNDQLSFYEREHLKLVNKVEAEKAARERCQAALAVAQAQVRDMELRTTEQQSKIDVKLEDLASREAALQIRERSRAIDSRRPPTGGQPPKQQKGNGTSGVTLTQAGRYQQTAFKTTVIQYTRSTSSTSCSSSNSSSGNSSTSSKTEQNTRIPRPKQQERKGVIAPSLIDSGKRKVDIASIANAAIETAAANGKRKLDAFNNVTLSGTVLADVKKRPRMHFQLAALRQRV